MNNTWNTDRRRFLKGLGASIALPMLDAMVPTRALASVATKTPVRLGFFFIPNGVHLNTWTPKQTGFDFDLPKTLSPLQGVKSEINVITGLTHDKGRANGDGAGDHARSAGVFLTATQPLKSEGAEIRAGKSIDQWVAEAIGHETRFASLELGSEGGRPFGKCDSGYACAYSNNISWKNDITPMAKMVNPREVFERLFASDLQSEVTEAQARRQNYRKSILDFVLEDAKALERKVGKSDQRKLGEYLAAIRDIETRLEKTEKEVGGNAALLADVSRPDDTPDLYDDHIKLLGDMMILAFQTDVTRVSTFMLANAGSNRSYRQVGVNEGHHSLSHHQNDPVKNAKIQKIDQCHVSLFAYILEKMRATPDGDGNLLDNSFLVFGSSISDGNRHNNENLPIVTAGRAGGQVLTGRHLIYPEETPMANLLVSAASTAGVDARGFGDATGTLRYLNG